MTQKASRNQQTYDARTIPSGHYFQALLYQWITRAVIEGPIFLCGKNATNWFGICNRPVKPDALCSFTVKIQVLLLKGGKKRAWNGKSGKIGID
jgi:hypothetical protein